MKPLPHMAAGRSDNIMAGRKPNLYIIAGPNGVGKTTFAREFLPHYVDCLEFVNASMCF